VTATWTLTCTSSLVTVYAERPVSGTGATREEAIRDFEKNRDAYVRELEDKILALAAAIRELSAESPT
jgi:hypothetical protein